MRRDPDTASLDRAEHGPFSGAKEPLGGHYLVEADSRHSAIELAARIPAARMGGAVEVRPVVEQ